MARQPLCSGHRRAHPAPRPPLAPGSSPALVPAAPRSLSRHVAVGCPKEGGPRCCPPVFLLRAITAMVLRPWWVVGAAGVCAREAMRGSLVGAAAPATLLEGL